MADPLTTPSSALVTAPTTNPAITSLVTINAQRRQGPDASALDTTSVTPTEEFSEQFVAMARRRAGRYGRRSGAVRASRSGLVPSPATAQGNTCCRAGAALSPQIADILQTTHSPQSQPLPRRTSV